MLVGAALLLAGCGTGADQEPEEGPSTSAPASTAAEESGEAGGSTSATEVMTVWVDESWTVTEQDTDLCEAGGGLMVSPHSTQEDVFLCAQRQEDALACAVEDGIEVVCLTDARQRTAIRFESELAAGTDPLPAEVTPRSLLDDPIPMLVTLEDGVQCDTMLRLPEHDLNLQASFRCEDGSTLVSSDAPSDTFEQGDTWTVRRTSGIDAEMETVAVQQAVFAGR